MKRCPYCGDPYIGNRAGIGTHVSSVAIGVSAGLVAMAAGIAVRLIWDALS